MKVRVGFGYDVHALVPERDLWLGGVKIEHTMGLQGHSDADVLIHAICDVAVTPVTAVTERKCTDFCQRHTMPFRSGKSRFWSKPREGKGKFAATPRLTPVARRVAACGPPCGLVRRRWGTDTPRPIWARVGELFGAPKAKQEKEPGTRLPRLSHFCPQCGQFPAF